MAGEQKRNRRVLAILHEIQIVFISKYSYAFDFWNTQRRSGCGFFLVHRSGRGMKSASYLRERRKRRGALKWSWNFCGGQK
jgi:hypothetical protein